jgi:signal transduction histidine kinase
MWPESPYHQQFSSGYGEDRRVSHELEPATLDPRDFGRTLPL